MSRILGAVVLTAALGAGAYASDADGLPMWFDLSKEVSLRTSVTPLPKKVVPEVGAVDAKYAAAVCVKNGEKLVAMGGSPCPGRSLRGSVRKRLPTVLNPVSA